MEPRKSILMLLVLCYQGYQGTSQTDEYTYYSCVEGTARLPPLSVPRPTCRFSAQVIRNLATVEGCSSLQNYLPILNSLSNTQDLIYDGTGVSLFDAAHYCFMNLTRELCYTHNLCITCIDVVYASTSPTTFYEIEACRMFVYEELTRGEERSNYELYKFMTLIEALYSTGYYSGSATGATPQWLISQETASQDGYTQAFLNRTSTTTTDVHEHVRDLLLGCLNLIEFFDTGPYACYNEIENRICSKYTGENAHMCNFVLENTIADVYMEVCTQSGQEEKCADILASILQVGGLTLSVADIKVIRAIISSSLDVGSNSSSGSTLQLLNLAIERFTQNETYIATLLDNQDANGFLAILNTLLSNERVDELERLQNGSGVGIDLLDNLNDMSRLLALALIGGSTKISTDYSYNDSNLYMFLESSSPMESYSSGNLSLDAEGSRASISIPASQICQNLTVVEEEESGDDTNIRQPGDGGGIDDPVTDYGEGADPWPWCTNETSDYSYYGGGGYGGGGYYGGGYYGGGYYGGGYYGGGYYGAGGGYDYGMTPQELFPNCLPEEINEKCLTVVATSVTRSIPTLLSSTLPNNLEIASLVLSSQIVTNSSTNSLINDTFTQPLSENATLSFVLNQRINLETSTPVCHYWDNKARVWSTEGVETLIISDVEVECITSHLTSFAVLVDHQAIIEEISEGERLALEITGYVGVSISVVCLIVTVVLLLYMKKRMSSSQLYYIHLNLSISLLLALALLLIGLTTATDIRALCGVIAGFLHYLFLCVFCWMLSEGIMLLLSVVDVFGTMTKRWYLFLLLGWGLPVPIVAISAGIRYEQYGTPNYCWLSADKGVIWAFVGPMIAICVFVHNAIFMSLHGPAGACDPKQVNTGVLLFTLSKVNQVVIRKKRKARLQRRHYNAVKSGLLSLIVLMPLLGITWIIGVFAITRDSTVFLWIFTILNSLQGSALLFMQILRIRKKDNKKQTTLSSLISDTRTTIKRLASKSSISEINVKNKSGRGRSYSPPITKLGDSSTYISSIVEKPSIEELELAIVNGNTVDAVVNGNKAGAPIP